MKYEYSAYVTGVYDGDSITVDIDLGFGVVLKKQKLRLLNIDTPEMRGIEKHKGTIVRDWVRDKILNENIVVRTHKDKKGKYGRWLAEVYYQDDKGVQQCLNDELIDQGYYRKY